MLVPQAGVAQSNADAWQLVHTMMLVDTVACGHCLGQLRKCQRLKTDCRMAVARSEVLRTAPFEKLIVSQLAKHYPSRCGIQSFIACSQEPAKCSYPEPD
jgi:hypothetical protein